MMSITRILRLHTSPAWRFVARPTVRQFASGTESVSQYSQEYTTSDQSEIDLHVHQMGISNKMGSTLNNGSSSTNGYQTAEFAQNPANTLEENPLSDENAKKRMEGSAGSSPKVHKSHKSKGKGSEEEPGASWMDTGYGASKAAQTDVSGKRVDANKAFSRHTASPPRAGSMDDSKKVALNYGTTVEQK
ncbi:putative mitochondrial protein [Andalucia godoyi]|uniref:Putative mitochondrial protein n=1 Tax=Andalucia godoyi TaxID=505711 RepID=A0A8K0F1Z8_ANDGO|nr:putative mitochondrial protein [Andalucia godoyi]|eukprot:ANDGO_01516.mRNA.1 putative mitochondrial protein